TPVWLWNFSMVWLPSWVPWVNLWVTCSRLKVGGACEGALDGGGRCDLRGDEVGATTLALAALEVAVGGRRGALAGGQLVRVHAQAHGAARGAPLSARGEEDLVQTFLLCLLLDSRGRRDDEHLDAVGDPSAVQNLGGGAQVLDAGVGAGAQEDHIHRDVPQRDSRGQVHVLQGALSGGPVGVVGAVLRCGAGRAQRQALARVGSPGDERGEAGSVDVDDRVELRALVGAQGLPVLDRVLPVLTFRGVRAALEVVEGRLVWGDHAGSGASLDGHVADGHAGFHRQLLDGLATVLNDVPLAAAGADLRDDGEDQVLGGDTRLQLAADLDGHGLEGLQRQGLGGQHVLDLGGADAHGDGAEGTVGGGVGVTTHHRHSRLSQAELWSDGVDDALIDVAHRVQADAKLFGVLAQSRDLQ